MSGSYKLRHDHPFNNLKIATLTACILLGLGLKEAKSETTPILVKTTIFPEVSAGVSRTFLGKVSATQSVDLGCQVGGA